MMDALGCLYICASECLRVCDHDDVGNPLQRPVPWPTANCSLCRGTGELGNWDAESHNSSRQGRSLGFALISSLSIAILLTTARRPVTPLSAEVDTKFRRQVAVAQSV
jgi:hypothetical protein